MAMTEDQKQAERDKLFEMFTDGKTTVEGLFQYLTKLAEDSRNTHLNSPFHGKKTNYFITIRGEKTSIQSFTPLDRMIEYLLYDEANISAYKQLRWNNTGDSPSTYKRNVDKIEGLRTDIDNFRQAYHNSLPGWPLTYAAKTILDRLEGLKDTDKDVEFWEKVLNIVPNIATSAAVAPDLLKSAKGIISNAIETSQKKCVIFTGAPGTGKTHCVEQYVKEQTGQPSPGVLWEFVQFHSSYDYTDFVEGLRPVQGATGMEFVRMDGIFKDFCRRAAETEKKELEKEPEEKSTYYFIIDEINRADLGRVFGELMYCFEKRGADHWVKTQYHNLLEKGDFFADGFYIPKNVVIIGTMNDIDRSVETFDFALRRRFDWKEIDANTVMASSLKSMAESKEKVITGEITEELVDRIKRMNEAIAHGPGLNSAFAIGPAYFKGYDGKNLTTIWERNIEPILKEYVRGRQKADTFIKDCRAALGLPQESDGDE